MQPVIDLSREYGLVLEGGGAKGAYQIGAWRALKEAGVRIRGVAGTSVGALNGALICMDDLEQAEKLWKTIAYSKVMDVDDERMAQLFDKEKQKPELLRETLRDTFRVLGEGGADIAPLRRLIEENIDEERIRNSPMEFYSCTYSVTDRKELDVDMKAVPEGQMQDMLLASSYLPVFKNEKLHGKTYVDGGVTNVLPVNTLLDRGYENLILIRIFGVGHEKRINIPEEVTVLEIAPRSSLGSILQFDGAKSRRNMRMGYYDALRMLYGLEGKIYYIEQTQEECYYLKRLIGISSEVMGELLAEHKRESGLDLREYLERFLPQIAAELKLGSDWSYKTLYLTMLEASARMLRIGKYRVYTVEELETAVRKKAQGQEGVQELPAFVRVILNR
ncbi:patatin-like phospholipase family protein [bacterium 1XD21-13]|nr:patatin-like phospholipase family protein [bacterium 1XD21-13]